MWKVLGLREPFRGKLGKRKYVCVYMHVCVHALPLSPQLQLTFVFPGLMFFFFTCWSRCVLWVSDMSKLASQASGMVETDDGCVSVGSIPRNGTSSNSIIQQKLLKGSACYLMSIGSCHLEIKKIKPFPSINRNLKKLIIIQKKLLFTSHRQIGRDSLLIQYIWILIVDFSCPHHLRQFIPLNWL